MTTPHSGQITQGPFEPTWDSLRQYQCPDWFRDAKFGIWAHWGPQCVPMVGDWYARKMYQPNEAIYHHHWRVYGHPSKVGYKDILTQWKAERFDPEGLMALYAAAGARYFVAQAAHHDNFDNWNSQHNRWNATKVGPCRNIVALWQEAARKRNLRFGLSEHLGATFSWMRFNKYADETGPYAGVPYDGNDPDYEDLYLPNQGEGGDWYTSNPWWHEHWFARIKDLIDQHQPDLLYSDGGVPFDEVGLSIIAHLYNTSAGLHGGVNEAVYNQKNTDQQVYRVGVLDIERGQVAEVAEHPWQTDTCVGGWFYDSRRIYKTPAHVIQMLVDIISKNGNLLLNLPQLPDGTLDDECRWILKVLADWFAANAEGVYATRPWKIASEGQTEKESGAFKETPVEWTPADYRFTCKGNTVYAFQMKSADKHTAEIKSLGLETAGKVTGLRLLGTDAPVTYDQREGALVAQLPESLPAPYVSCLAATLA